MKVRVRYSTPDVTLDEVFMGADAEAVVAAMKAEAANRANFMVRMLVSSLTTLAFAQQVVSRYNEALGRTIPAPRSCAEFLELGKGEGIVTLLEP